MPPPRHTNPKALPRCPAPNTLHVALLLHLKLAPDFFQSFFLIPSYSLFKLMVIFLSFSTSFGQLLGCLSPWVYDHFSRFAARVIQAIRSKGGAAQGGHRRSPLMCSKEKKWQIFGSSMSPFSPWKIILALQSSWALQQHLSFPLVSIKGPLKRTNSLQLD